MYLMDAAPAHAETPTPVGRCFPHGVHSGVKLANFSTAGCIVSEHYYPVGLRMFEHAHETPFINASLPRRVHRTGSALGHREVLEPEVNFSPAGMEHPRLVTDNDYQLLHIDSRGQPLRFDADAALDEAHPQRDRRTVQREFVPRGLRRAGC
jgi:hypothetical protein